MNRIILCLVILALALMSACLSEGDDGIYVKAVENLPDGFIFGMDASSVIAEETAA